MIDTIIILFRSGIVLVFGIAVSLLFAGVQHKRKGELAIAVFYILMISIQILSWRMFGLQLTMKLYPFITHIPVITFIVLYFNRSWLISTSSVLTAYLCCQIPKWIGSVAAAVIPNRFADHIAYFVAMCVVYYFLKKYVADSVVQLVKRSKRSCLLFGAVPLFVLFIRLCHYGLYRTVIYRRLRGSTIYSFCNMYLLLSVCPSLLQ